MTNANGMALSTILSRQTGTYQYCVTDLVKDGHDYEPEDNETEACKAIEVGP